MVSPHARETVGEASRVCLKKSIFFVGCAGDDEEKERDTRAA